ncbi:MAG TPA: alpha/beta fold hydrolase [Burkholderiaceae bacterium]|nr:alpha/beta fold hydrolase [Burkholderiaceae bacterium]
MQISAGGVAIEVDDVGQGEPLLLLMGLGMQLVSWPDELVAELVARGFRVIRIDNRDVGLSQGFDHLGKANLIAATVRHMLGMRISAPYSLADMARDSFGVLDALGVASAHVCGVSMGGMIAQHMATMYPERVRRLTLMMTTSGSRSLPQPSARIRRALLSRPANSRDPEEIVAHLERMFALIGSPDYHTDPELFRRRLRASVARAWRPAGVARQIVAIVADGDRTPMLGRISAPTHIVHGASDPLVPVAAAHQLHRKIRGSTLEVIPGMGHDLPVPLLPRLAHEIARTD